MPLPIIADVFQARINWTNPNAPRDAVNTLHFKDDAHTHSAASLMAALDANVTSNMWGYMTGTGQANRVDITDLSGLAAPVSFPPATPAHWTGSSGTDAILQGCQVITVRSVLRGPAGRNRIFIPWIAETSQANGLLTPGSLPTIQAAWTAFLNAMIASSWSLWQVSPKTSTARVATSVVARPQLATQRRRARH